MTTKFEYEDLIPKTYKGDLINFVANKEYKLVYFFTVGGRIAYVNGQLCQVTESGTYFPIQTRGENLFYCKVCGTHIVNHYTVKDMSNGKEQNIGSECIKNIKLPKNVIADYIVSYTESIINKVKAENRRLPKNKQLAKFIQDNLETLNKLRNDRIDKELAIDPEKYYRSKYHVDTEKHKPQFIEVKFNNGKKVKLFDSSKVVYSNNLIDYSYEIEQWKNYNARFYRRGTFPSDLEIVDKFIRSKDAKNLEYKDRNVYNYLLNNLVTKNWQPNTMQQSLYEYLARDGFLQADLKWQKPTEDEIFKEKELVTKTVNEYIERLTRQ